MLLLLALPILAQDVPGSVSGFDRAALRVMVRTADSLFRIREFRAAESAYTAVLGADSNSIAGLAGLANAALHNPGTRRDYQGMLNGLEKAVRLSPDNPSLLIAYGRALLPWRFDSKTGPDSLLLVRARRNLMRGLGLAPHRTEARLDLYLCCLAQKDYSRADSQLRHLAAKNLFPGPAVDFAYDLLVSLDSGAVLFTNGDLDMFPALMLQQVESLRQDVTVVNIPLLNLPWYVKYLKHERKLSVPFRDDQIDTLQRQYVPGLRRTLSPGLRILNAIVEEHGRGVMPHAPRSGCYFASTTDREVMALFKRRLSLEGFVYRIVGHTVPVPPEAGSSKAVLPEAGSSKAVPVNRKRCLQNLTRDYRIPDFAQAAADDRLRTAFGRFSAPLMHDYQLLADNCAAAYLALAEDFAASREIPAAVALLDSACRILVAAGRSAALQRVLDYWLKIAPTDTKALRLRRDLR